MVLKICRIQQTLKESFLGKYWGIENRLKNTNIFTYFVVSRGIFYRLRRLLKISLLIYDPISGNSLKGHKKLSIISNVCEIVFLFL